MIKKIIIALFILSTCSYSYASPSISNVSGTFGHGDSITITCTGAGTKSQSAPVIWDNCSGTSITQSGWTGGLPTTSGSTYNIGYRTPAQVGRGITLPHSNVTKYMCGAHTPASDFYSGYNVMAYKARTIASFPAYMYASWYQRYDNGWTFGDDTHNNLKMFDYSCGNSPYTQNSPTDSNWYIEYNPRPSSNSSSCGFHINDDGSSLYNSGAPNYLDRGGHEWWWDSGINPMANSWTKIEVQIIYTDQTNGSIKLWENGTLKVNYIGETDKYAGTSRNEGIGGYSGMESSQTGNWRYFNDIYLDTTFQRVVIIQGSLIEVQIPSSWSDTSITCSVNRGSLQDGAATLRVYDSLGNYDDYSVTISGGSTPSTTTATIRNCTLRNYRST